MDIQKNISSIYRKMTVAINTSLTILGLSSAKAMFLFCLYDHEQMTQVEICRELNMDKSTVAKMLVRMENDGLVSKKIHPADVRAIQVSLTEKAVALVPQARRIQQECLDQITEGLTNREKRDFMELIDKVASY